MIQVKKILILTLFVLMCLFCVLMKVTYQTTKFTAISMSDNAFRQVSRHQNRSDDDKTEASLTHLVTVPRLQLHTTQRPSRRKQIADLDAIEMPFGHVYIFGAAAGNRTNETTWDIVKIYGSIAAAKFKLEDLKCCLLYKFHNRTDIIQTSVLGVTQHWAHVSVQTFHCTCHNIWHKSRNIPDGVALSLKQLTCNDDTAAYKTIYKPLKEADTKVVLTSQVTYSNISAELIIEWMEAYKYLGVDKVISYYFRNINQQALNVLQYYYKSGFVDLYQYIPAAEDVRWRDFQRSKQLYNDLSLVNYDAFERTSGTTYFGIMDFDEFLIPSRNRTIKEMLADLRVKYKTAAGFAFKTQYFFTSWGPTNNSSDLIIEQYTNRSAEDPKLDRVKQLLIPQYIKPGRWGTHWSKPVKGFQRVTVPTEEGFLRHYRSCRSAGTGWQNYESCLYKDERVPDNSVAFWFMRIKENIRRARREIFNTTWTEL